VNLSLTPPEPTPSSPGALVPSPAPSDFGSFYRKTLVPLRGYLSRLLGSKHEAQDIAHDAYLKTYQAMHAQPIQEPKAYLFRSARNLAHDFRTRRASRMLPTDDSLLEAAAPESPGTADLVIVRQESADLHAAILSLPPRCREVLALRSFEGLSHAAIAERLGISRSAVEKQIARALRLLRDRLTPPK
jgi:RNA polymerase sigma-70 factor (ECF subfamily)